MMRTVRSLTFSYPTCTLFLYKYSMGEKHAYRNVIFKRESDTRCTL